MDIDRKRDVAIILVSVQQRLLFCGNRILFKGRTSSGRFIWEKNPESSIVHLTESYSLLETLHGYKYCMCTLLIYRNMFPLVLYCPVEHFQVSQDKQYEHLTCFILEVLHLSSRKPAESFTTYSETVVLINM